MSEIKQQIESWVSTEAQSKVDNYYAKMGYNNKPTLEVSFGRKYAKIMSARSVWGFVAMSEDVAKAEVVGDLLKAASWSAPAKHARGNILNGSASYDSYGPNYLK
jgi:hypothetical protein